jgi:hypothetical protein
MRRINAFAPVVMIGGVEHIAKLTIPPRIQRPAKTNGCLFLQVNPYGDFAVSIPPPFLEAIGRNHTAAPVDQIAKGVWARALGRETMTAPSPTS